MGEMWSVKGDQDCRVEITVLNRAIQDGPHLGG